MADYLSVLKANIEYHNRHAKAYDAVTMQGHFKRVEPTFEAHKGGVMLDMGCGTGEQMKIGQKYFDEVWGIDCSPGMLELARQVSPNVIEAVADNVPLPSNKFDFINCFSVFHHCFETEPVVRESYRLLKNGGAFYSDNDSNAKFYKAFGWWIVFRRRFIRHKSKELDKDLKQLEEVAEFHQKEGLSAEGLAEEFRRAGFKEVRIDYHYPDSPDVFTKILIVINTFLKNNSLYYYFSIVAKK